jgi:hypothetical protein
MMKRRKLLILLEAIAFTLCLAAIAEQQPRMEISSQAPMSTFPKRLDRGSTLGNQQTLTTSCLKASCTQL